LPDRLASGPAALSPAVKHRSAHKMRMEIDP
jgi:hypothetical protein